MDLLGRSNQYEEYEKQCGDVRRGRNNAEVEQFAGWL
jgi:hypothetical protein